MRYKTQDAIDQENHRAAHKDFKRWQKIVAERKGWDYNDVRLTSSLIGKERTNQRTVIAQTTFNMHVVKVPYRMGLQSNDNGWGKDAVHYQVRVWIDNKERYSYVSSYSQGSGIKQFPTIREILFSLLQDAMLGAYSFRDYCDNMGADRDSRESYRIYETCVETFDWLALSGLYQSQIFNITGILQEAENAGDVNDERYGAFNESATERDDMGDEIPF